MRKIILAPDSFKGTMSSQEICDILAQEIKRVWPQAQVVSLPVADGGEGSVDAFLAAVGGEKVAVPCKGPHWEDIHGFYGLLPDGTAVVEMAAAAGLPLVGQRLRPDQTTTYGVGQLVRAAVCGGARRLVVGLGGSATNDGGAGMAAALGVRFFRADGEPYIPTGGTLDQLDRVDCGTCRAQGPQADLDLAWRHSLEAACKWGLRLCWMSLGLTTCCRGPGW